MPENIRNSNTYYNKDSTPNQAYHYQIKYVDAMNGNAVDINSFTDSIRLARAGTNVRDIPNKLDTIVHSETIPTDYLSKFVTRAAEKFSPSDAVSALGLYITDYIVDRITNLGDKNSDLSKNDDSFTNTITFRDYIKGGTAYVKNVLNGLEENSDEDNSQKESNSGESEKSSRISADMGIGVGESFVLNPTWQFNKRDDPRTNPMYTKIGRVYSTQLMAHWPVALIQPGRFKYNTSFFKLMGLGSGAGLQESLIRSGGDGLSGIFKKFIMAPIDLISTVGTIGSAVFGGNKILEFKQAYNLFNQYTRFLFTSLASMMGLLRGNKYVGARSDLNLYNILPTMGLGKNPTKYKNNQFLPFRCGKAITASESFTNSTSPNPLEESLNAKAEENDPNKNAENAAAVSGDVTGAIFGKLKKFALSTAGNFSEQALVMSGRGRVSLPEVFSSSSFSRSFSFDFKFHSPYGDNISIFENEYIPFLILLALSAPRQIGKMTYTSPFAVRISVKNKVMINYGLVESLTVTRGGDSNDWTPSGYPKTLTCSLQVKDLEPTISLPLASRGPLRAAVESMFPSSGISEYLSSLGGLTLEDINVFFNKKRFSRASQVFTSTWNAKLSWDSLMSTVMNSSPVNNIVSLFATTDLDNIGETLTKPKSTSLSEDMANQIDIRGTMPGFYQVATEINGQGGNSAVNLEGTLNIAEINELNNLLEGKDMYT